jgi:hypothetical protein
LIGSNDEFEDVGAFVGVAAAFLEFAGALVLSGAEEIVE